MRIAICDDEKNIRELIENKVIRQYPKAEIVFFSSGEELLLSDMHIDILFLDIQMSGRDGMETARELRKLDNDVMIIFVTAIEEYVFQAFDSGSFTFISCERHSSTALQSTSANFASLIGFTI